MALVFGAGGVAGAFVSWRRLSPEHGAFLRVMYENRTAPIWLRNQVAMVPLWTIGSLLLGGAGLLPRLAAQWVALAAVVVATIAFGLSYRVPAPLLPTWLRQDIRQGRVEVASPDRGDWLLFVMAMAVAALGIPSVILLIVVFHAGNP
jgi:hypothetical protein